MNTEAILRAIDEQIGNLQQARQLLTGSSAPAGFSLRRGQPKGSKNSDAVAPANTPVKVSKRVISAEGKARIAAAQKRRWQEQKADAASKKSSVKTTVVAKKRAAAKPRAANTIAEKKAGTAEE